MPYSHGYHWDSTAIARLKELRDLGMTSREIADYFGVTIATINNAAYEHGVKFPQKKLILPDLKTPPKIEDLLEYVAQGQGLMREFDQRQREAFPVYKTNGWVGVIFHGDWHFEHYKTDLVSLVKELKEIGKSEDVFYVFNGDIGDFSDIRFKGYSLPSIVFPIQLRYQIIFHLASQIKNLLAVVSGCHDDWLKNRGFYDIIGALQQKRNELGLKTYYLGYGGTINFRVGQNVYKMAAYHKFGSESRVNDFHPCSNYLRHQDATADIVAIAHRHDKVGVSFQYYQHRPVIFVRSGSHQYITDYAWKEGFSGAIAKAPMVLLNGKQREMRACVNYKEGLEELKSLNEKSALRRNK